MEPDIKIRGRPKQNLTDAIQRNLQTRQHRYYVNYKTKKNKYKITPPVVEIVNESPPKLQELLNEIVRIIDVIRDSFKK
jgi:hypothetical protein